MEQGLYNEKAQLNEIIKILKNAFKTFNSIEKIKPNDPEALEKLENFIKKIPSVDILSHAIEENINIANKTIEEVKSNRMQSFKRVEAEYIRGLKEQGKIYKERSNGWRVGCLEIITKPELSKISILYNNETLIQSTTVISMEELTSLEEQAMLKLKGELIAENELIDSFWEAYQQCMCNNKSANSRLVPIKEFYKEVRVSLIRGFLECKNPTAVIDKYTNFPLWAFLFNLDTYRSLGRNIPDNKKLGLQTGSMQETSKGKGFIVNGLNTNEDYKVMCYVISVSGGDGR